MAINLCLPDNRSVEVKVFNKPPARQEEETVSRCTPATQHKGWICWNSTSNQHDQNYFLLESRVDFTSVEHTSYSSYLKDAQVSWKDAQLLCENLTASLPSFATTDFIPLRFLIKKAFHKIKGFFIGLHRVSQVAFSLLPALQQIMKCSLFCNREYKGQRQ